MVGLFISAGLALMAALVGTPVLIRSLQARGIGQQIREEGPEGHLTKAGTPTMGGLMILGAAAAGYLAAHLRSGATFTAAGALVVLAILGTGLVGLVDDWISVTRQRSLGLNKRAKLAGQVIVALTFGILAVTKAKVSTDLSFTRSIHVHLSQPVYVIWAVLVIVAMSNAVNLTDGLDGLAAGSSAFAFAAFVFIGFWEFRHQVLYGVGPGLDLALGAAAMTGACTGFLWWNAAPARIFMGDTGALAIGAGLGALALTTNTHLLLPIVGGLFVLETLSVVVQVISFRSFHRRVFRMAPIHHHFELLGWPETTVIIRFWILAALFTALSVGIFYADFLSTKFAD
ncbi:MAG: phospho-N-acetylmuramoyl-pentapeptide-transferase [Acidimicrobiales bacterium]|nr:phospho-N-acetylmuramoyl-pentapeptide-transferase [Acidimicrobiales bacterium]